MALIVVKTGMFVVAGATVGTGAVALIADTGLTAGEIITIIVASSTAICGIIAAVVTGLVTIRAAYKKAEDEATLKTAYAGIAQEMMQAYLKNENKHRKQAGKPPIELPAAVVAEGSSPPTASQQQDAALATMRAHAALLLLQTGQPARKEPNGHSGAEVAAAPLVEVLDTIKTDAAALVAKAEAAKKLVVATPPVPAAQPSEPAPAASPEQKTVEKLGEQIGDKVVKAAEKKIIKEVKTSKEDIIEHLDKEKP